MYACVYLCMSINMHVSRVVDAIINEPYIPMPSCDFPTNSYDFLMNSCDFSIHS